MFIGIVEIWFRIAIGQISSFFDRVYLPATHLCFCFRTIIWVNLIGFSPNLICALILWWYGLGLLFGTFPHFWQLSPHNTIMARYYCFTFLFYFTETKAVHFLWNISKVDDFPEMWSHIVSEKLKRTKKKTNTHTQKKNPSNLNCCLLLSW